MSNEVYEPWKARGITEVEYWKMRYLETRRELRSLVLVAKDYCFEQSARRVRSPFYDRFWNLVKDWD